MIQSTVQSPFNWIEKDGKNECHYNAQRGDVTLGTIEEDLVSFKPWLCKVNTGLIDDIKVIEERFAEYEHAKEYVESGGHKRLCEECSELHYGNSFCDCGACLYENSKSLNDPNHPFFECTKCHQVNYWD